MIFRLSSLLALALVVSSCAPSGPEPTTAQTSANDLRTDDARLQGAWKLMTYTPDVPPDPMTAMLFTAQLNTMTVRFENGKMLAQSPTIDVVRGYRMENAAGPRFEIVARDETGLEYRSTCEYSADGRTIAFHGDTDPWRGNGTLMRVGNLAGARRRR